MSGKVDVRESPEFASICSFISLFGADLNLNLSHLQLADFLQTADFDSTPKQWIDIHRKLLNRIKVTCSNEKWESSLKRFINATLDSETVLPDLYDKDYFSITSQQKARVLNIILDCQFDKNIKFKEKVNLKQNKDLRVQPFGSDIHGCLYWLFVDTDVNIIMYKENLEEESFKIIAENVEGLHNLLTDLETIDCENVDLSVLYIESITPEDTNSPNNDTDLLKTEDILKSENEVSTPVKVEESEEISVIDRNGDKSPIKSETDITNNTHMKSEIKIENNSESDCKLIIATMESEESSQVKESSIHEETTGEMEKVSNESEIPQTKEKKKRGRKPKMEPIVVDTDVAELNSSLRRSERKRKPVNPFNIIYTPISIKKSKITDSKPETEDSLMSKYDKKLKSKDKENKKRGRPKKSRKHSSPDKDFKLKNKFMKKIKDKMKSHKKHKQKHKQKQKQPWEEAESSEHIEDEEEEDLYQHEESDVSPVLKEDSLWNDKPESDFDPDNLSVSCDEEMLKSRGRNFFRQKKRLKKVDEEEITDDKPCQICLRVTLPEMILLCDQCDFGHHAMCLKPSLMLIPEGEWFCPKCQHRKLITNLSNKINELEKSLAKNVAKMRMQERLNFVNTSMTNILNTKRRHKPTDVVTTFYESSSPSCGGSSSESDQSGTCSSSESSKEQEGCRYKFRESSRKENTRYNFEEIDKMFDNALETDEKYQMIKKRQRKDENECDESDPEYDYSGIEPRKKSSGKDMSNILEAEKPQLNRPSKKKRLRYQSDDDFEDDARDQDFKLSSEGSCSDLYDDDDDKISNIDPSDSDDHQWMGRARRSTRKSHKKKEKRKPRVEFEDVVSRPRRSASRKVNYLEMLGEDEEGEDDDVGNNKKGQRSPDFGSSDDDTSKPPPVLSWKKSKVVPRRRKISDSDYEESNNSGSTERLQSAKNKMKSCLDSCTESERDEEDDDEKKEKKLIIEETDVNDSKENEQEEKKDESKEELENAGNMSRVKERIMEEEKEKGKDGVEEKSEEKKMEEEERKVCSLSILNPMRAKDDQDIDVENEVESSDTDGGDDLDSSSLKVDDDYEEEEMAGIPKNKEDDPHP